MLLPQWLAGVGLPSGWRRGAPLPESRFESAVAVLNDRLYVFGGFYFRLKASTRADRYDPRTNTWSRIADLPVPVTHINGVLDGEVLWIAGGFVGNHPGPTTNQVWQYNIKTNRWTPGIPLPAVRASGGFQRVGRSLYYFGGFDSDRDTTCTEHWQLDLDSGTEWVPRSPLPQPRGHVASIVLNDQIYAIGGQIRHDTNPVDQTNVYRYDPVSDCWSELAPLPEPRSHFEPGTFLHRGHIVITGGRNNHRQLYGHWNLFRHHEDRVIDDLPHRGYIAYRKLKGLQTKEYLYETMLAYNPQTNTWHPLPSLPARFLAPVANVINNLFILTGGSKTWPTNPQSRTLLNETLLDAIGSS